MAALALLVPAVAQAGTSLRSPFNPSSHDFGTIAADADPASQAFTLTNPGTKATGALKVSLSPASSSAFSITADTCTPMSLGPKKSCSVTVKYDPTSAGSSDSGTLIATSKKPAASGSASLSGRAHRRHLHRPCP